MDSTANRSLFSRLVLKFFYCICVSISFEKNEEFVTVMPRVKLKFFVRGKKITVHSFKTNSTHFSSETYCMKL